MATVDALTCRALRAYDTLQARGGGARMHIATTLLLLAMRCNARHAPHPNAVVRRNIPAPSCPAPPCPHTPERPLRVLHHGALLGHGDMNSSNGLGGGVGSHVLPTQHATSILLARAPLGLPPPPRS